MRLNGYVLYSVGGDELSSARLADPAMPFLYTFSDSGNPPFYYILLRFWFSIFGWTEASGRMLSVLIGSGVVAAVYFLAKKFAGPKTALLASLFTAVTRYVIRVSHNTRCYILLMLLISVIAVFFLNIINKHNKKDAILYVVFCSLIVNTHYYGVLLVTANFIFYVLYGILNKQFSLKKTLQFLIANIIIAVSLLPFMIITAFSGALLDKNFNDWIPTLGVKMIVLIGAGVPVFSLLYWVFRSLFIKKECFKNQQKLLLDYTVFICLLILFQAFLISLARPIITLRYLAFLSPLLITGIAVFFTLHFPRNWINFSFAAVSFLFSLALYHLMPHTSFFDVSKEALNFITADSLAHSDAANAVLERYDNHEGYYGYDQVTVYKGDNTINVLYISPLHCVEEEMYTTLGRYDLNRDNILKIQINESKRIMKKYF
jgi:uncharacterized membrane protein